MYLRSKHSHITVFFEGCRPDEAGTTDVKLYSFKLDTDAQNQKAVSAYFTSKQILPFGFAERCGMSAPRVKGHQKR